MPVCHSDGYMTFGVSLYKKIIRSSLGKQNEANISWQLISMLKSYTYRLGGRILWKMAIQFLRYLSLQDWRTRLCTGGGIVQAVAEPPMYAMLSLKKGATASAQFGCGFQPHNWRLRRGAITGTCQRHEIHQHLGNRGPRKGTSWVFGVKETRYTSNAIYDSQFTMYD